MGFGLALDKAYVTFLFARPASSTACLFNILKFEFI
jgi:hypothetical protein